MSFLTGLLLDALSKVFEISEGSGNRATDSNEAIANAIAGIPSSDLSVPSANSSDNVDMPDVAGNKTDTPVEAVSAVASLVGYIKGLVQEMAQRDTAKVASATHAGSSSTSYSDIVNITDKGVLTGISQSIDAAAGNAYIKIVLDGVTITDSATIREGSGIGLSFNHRFNTSLQVQHKTQFGSAYQYTSVAYTID